MRTPIGTTAWAAASGGALSSWERNLESLRAARGVLRAEGQKAARRLGFGPRPFALALAEVPLPRSALADAAAQRLGLGPAWNVGHSLRSYLWAALLARRDGLVFDAEVLFAASALHDVGLVEGGPQGCFAWRGAEVAREVCRNAGADAARAAAVADAICQHLNVVPSGAVEARLVRAGAGFDVIGDRFFELAAETRRAVVEAHSREGFRAGVTEALLAQARAHPRTRVGFLCDALRFPVLIARADGWFARDARQPR